MPAPEQEAPPVLAATFPPNTAPPIPNQMPPPLHQSSQATLSAAALSQYGMPPTNLFPGPGQYPFHPGYQFQQFGFPMLHNPYLPPANPTPFNSLAVPNYHHLQSLHHPYGNTQPTNYPPMNWQPTPPFQHPPPMPNTHSSLPSSRHFRSPNPTFGTLSTEDPSEFPELKDWLESVDQDRLRGQWGHQFSQLSAGFELDGFDSLLDLEGITVDALVSGTGIDEQAAQRLLRFVREDIDKIRADKPPHAKRGRLSY